MFFLYANVSHQTRQFLTQNPTEVDQKQTVTEVNLSEGRLHERGELHILEIMMYILDVLGQITTQLPHGVLAETDQLTLDSKRQRTHCRRLVSYH